MGLLWWWGWPRTEWLGLLVLGARRRSWSLENSHWSPSLLFARHRASRAARESPRTPRNAASPRRPLRLVVAHGAEDSLPSARTCSWCTTSPTVPQRATDSTSGVRRRPPQGCAGHLLHPRRGVDLRRQARAGSPDAARVRRAAGGSWSRATTDWRRRHPWPAQIEDVTRTLAWIKKNIASHGGDPERVVVAGGSAGGHLAALLALSADDPTWRPERRRAESRTGRCAGASRSTACSR